MLVVENVGTPNIANNTSDVRARLYLRNTTVTFSGYTISGYMNIHTSKFTYNASPSMLSQNSSILLLDKTLTVTHNDDGSKYIAVNASISGQGGYSPNTLNLSGGAFDLPTIARASTVAVNDLDIGSVMTINITRASSSFTHNVRYNWNGKTGTIGTAVATQTTWTVPMDFCNDVPNSDYYWGTVYVDTYNGSTLIGTKTAVFKGYVPASVKPTLTSVAVTDSNSKAVSLVSPNFIQIISQPIATVNGATGAYGSTIESYNIQVVGKNQSTTSNGGSLGIFNWSGTATVQATVTDSRGRTSAPVTTTVTVLEYKPPAFSFTAVRSGANKSQITVTRSATISPLIVGGVQKNKMVMSFKTAPVNTTTFTVDTSNASGTFVTTEMINQSATLNGAYPVNQSFDVYGLLSDNFISSAEVKQSVGVEEFPFTYDKTGMGIGKVRQLGVLDVSGDIYSAGKLIQHYQVTDNTGKISRLDNIDLNTIINDSKPIAVYATTNTPIAGHGYYYLEVFQHTAGSNYVMQRATTRAYAGGVRVFERIRENGIWQSWVELLTANSPSMINTDWIAVGNSFYYKQIGDVVYLRYDFASNGVTRFSAGNMPSNLTSNDMMFAVTGWTTAVDKQIHIQVNASGLIEWINPSAYKNNYRGQISWAI